MYSAFYQLVKVLLEGGCFLILDCAPSMYILLPAHLSVGLFEILFKHELSLVILLFGLLPLRKFDFPVYLIHCKRTFVLDI